MQELGASFRSRGLRNQSTHRERRTDMVGLNLVLEFLLKSVIDLPPNFIDDGAA
jgi:hypothetical protein